MHGRRKQGRGLSTAVAAAASAVVVVVINGSGDDVRCDAIPSDAHTCVCMHRHARTHRGSSSRGEALVDSGEEDAAGDALDEAGHGLFGLVWFGCEGV